MSDFGQAATPDIFGTLDERRQEAGLALPVTADISDRAFGDHMVWDAGQGHGIVAGTAGVARYLEALLNAAPDLLDAAQERTALRAELERVRRERDDALGRLDRMRRGLRAADTELGHALAERDAARAELEGGRPHAGGAAPCGVAVTALDDATVQRLTELNRKALPAPWHVEYLGEKRYPQRIANDAAVLVAETFEGVDPDDPVAANAELIAEARNALPDLLDAARERDALRAELERARREHGDELRDRALGVFGLPSEAATFAEAPIPVVALQFALAKRAAHPVVREVMAEAGMLLDPGDPRAHPVAEPCLPPPADATPDEPRQLVDFVVGTSGTTAVTRVSALASDGTELQFAVEPDQLRSLSGMLSGAVAHLDGLADATPDERWADGEPRRRCTYTCTTHDSRCEMTEPRPWHEHEHHHLGPVGCAWGTDALVRYPAGHCGWSDPEAPHNPHRYGDPARWCDGALVVGPEHVRHFWRMDTDARRHCGLCGGTDCPGGVRPGSCTPPDADYESATPGADATPDESALRCRCHFQSHANACPATTHDPHVWRDDYTCATDGCPAQFSNTIPHTAATNEPAPSDMAPPEAPEPHGWTGHGHQCCGAHVYRAGRPALVARCGGPGVCTQCSRDAAQIHARPAQDGDAR